MVDIDEILRTAMNSAVLRENDKIVLLPYTDIFGTPSKVSISKLLLAFDHWFNIPEDKLQMIQQITETLHYSSLLIEDIEDSSILQRGKKVAHSIYGVGVTINASTFAIYQALDKVCQLNHSETTKMFSDYTLELYRGQGMDIFWRDTCTVPTEADYKLMALRKKGALLILSLGLMQLFSKNKEDFTQLIVVLGVYFEILEDNSKMFSRDQNDDEDFCKDLTDGRFNLPIIHAIRNEKYGSQVLTIMRRRSKNIEVKEYFIKLLVNAGSLKYTRDVLEELEGKARKEVARLGTNPYMEGLLNELSSWKD